MELDGGAKIVYFAMKDVWAWWCGESWFFILGFMGLNNMRNRKL